MHQSVYTSGCVHRKHERNATKMVRTRGTNISTNPWNILTKMISTTEVSVNKRLEGRYTMLQNITISCFRLEGTHKNDTNKLLQGTRWNFHGIPIPLYLLWRRYCCCFLNGYACPIAQKHLPYNTNTCVSENIYPESTCLQ